MPALFSDIPSIVNSTSTEPWHFTRFCHNFTLPLAHSVNCTAYFRIFGPFPRRCEMLVYMFCLAVEYTGSFFFCGILQVTSPDSDYDHPVEDIHYALIKHYRYGSDKKYLRLRQLHRRPSSKGKLLSYPQHIKEINESYYRILSLGIVHNYYFLKHSINHYPKHTVT